MIPAWIPRWITLFISIWILSCIRTFQTVHLRTRFSSNLYLEGTEGDFYSDLWLEWSITESIASAKIEKIMVSGHEKYSTTCQINEPLQTCFKCVNENSSNIKSQCGSRYSIVWEFYPLELRNHGSHLVVITLKNGKKIQKYFTVKVLANLRKNVTLVPRYLEGKEEETKEITFSWTSHTLTSIKIYISSNIYSYSCDINEATQICTQCYVQGDYLIHHNCSYKQVTWIFKKLKRLNQGYHNIEWLTSDGIRNYELFQLSMIVTETVDVSPTYLEAYEGESKSVVISWSKETLNSVNLNSINDNFPGSPTQHIYYGCNMNRIEQECQTCDIRDENWHENWHENFNTSTICVPYQIRYTFDHMEKKYQGFYKVSFGLISGHHLTRFFNIKMLTGEASISETTTTLAPTRSETVFEVKYILTIRNEDYQYSIDLADSQSQVFKTVEKKMCALVTNLVQSAFPSILVQCSILSFQSGSIIAKSELGLATESGSAAVPNLSEFASGLTEYCEMKSSNCSKVQPAGATYAESLQVKQKIYSLRIKNEIDDYSEELSDRNNLAFKQMEKTFCDLITKLIQTEFPSTVVRCIVLSFSSGSIIVESALEISSRNGSTVPSVSDIAQGLKRFCEQNNSDCSKIKPASETFAKSMRVIEPCYHFLLHSCSPQATCSSKGSIDYECTCQIGFKDTRPIFSELKGRTCTEFCEKDEYCLNEAQCKENIGTIKSCECRNGFAGKRCEIDTMFSFIITASVMGGVIFLIVAAVLVYLFVRRFQKRKKIDDYVDSEQTDRERQGNISVNDTNEGTQQEVNIYEECGTSGLQLKETNTECQAFQYLSSNLEYESILNNSDKKTDVNATPKKADNVITKNPGQERQPFICVVCYDKEICMVLTPCNHVCVCQNCVQRLQNCPMCNGDIIEVKKCFITRNDSSII